MVRCKQREVKGKREKGNPVNRLPVNLPEVNLPEVNLPEDFRESPGGESPGRNAGISRKCGNLPEGMRESPGRKAGISRECGNLPEGMRESPGGNAGISRRESPGSAGISRWSHFSVLETTHEPVKVGSMTTIEYETSKFFLWNVGEKKKIKRKGKKKERESHLVVRKTKRKINKQCLRLMPPPSELIWNAVGSSPRVVAGESMTSRSGELRRRRT